MNTTPNRSIQSVETAAEIIEYLRKANGGTISEIAAELEMSVGAVHTHLATLKQFGYVTQEKKTYRLGPQFLSLGEYVRNHTELYIAARDEINDLAEETGESAHLIIEHNGSLYALYEQFGPKAVGTEYHEKKREQSLSHLHCTAAGKAILAFSDRHQLSAIIEQNGLPKETPNTITEIHELDDELSKIKEHGVAFADEEQILGIRAVGAPVLDADGTVVGAIAVSGPSSRLKGEYFRQELPELVDHTTNVAELNFHTADR